MKKKIRLYLSILLATISVARMDIAYSNDVTLNFRNAELLAVLEFYSKLTGKVFVPAEQLTGQVTVISPAPLSEEQAVKMLFSILDMRGYAVVEVDNYYKVITKGSAINSGPSRYRTADASDKLVTEFITPENIGVGNIEQSIRALMSPEGKLIVDGTLNFIAITDSASNVSLLKSFIQSIDKPSAITVPQSKSYRLQYAQAAEVLPLVDALLQGESSVAQQPAPGGVPQGLPPGGRQQSNASVLSDIRTNTLIVSAPQPLHEKVQQLIDTLDTRSPQVLLEATIVEVILNDSSKLGVQWQFLLNGDPLAALSLATQDSGGLLSEAAGLSTQAGLNFGLLSPNDYAALLNLVASDTSATVLSAPHLMTSNNKEASLRVGDEIPFLKEFRLDADNNPIRTFERQEVGLSLNFTPSIAENRDVSIQLGINISSVRPGGTTDNNEFTTSEREINTNVVVKDQQTLVISGLMRDNNTDNSAGIPGLRKTPGVGKLFGNEEQNKEVGELLILIRPRVITTEDEARLAGDEQFRKHPKASVAGAIRPDGFEFDL